LRAAGGALRHPAPRVAPTEPADSSSKEKFLEQLDRPMRQLDSLVAPPKATLPALNPITKEDPKDREVRPGGGEEVHSGDGKSMVLPSVFQV